MATPAHIRSEFKSSELSRSSAEVFAAASFHPVTVTRRDGEDLVLMSKRESDARGELLRLAGQLIAMATTAEGSVTERMADRFPWMLALSEKDREDCATAVIDAARASFATDQPHLAIAELTSWEATAQAMAAGLAGHEVEWLDDPEILERP